MFHPEFERAEFRDDGFDLHRHDLACGSIGQSRKLYFQQTGFFQLTFGIGQDLARRVAASHRGREEPELCGLAGHKAECAILDQQFSSLLHALRHDTERLHRRAEPGYRRHRRFQTDVA